MTPANRQEAMALLRKVGAPARLYRHAELVGEAADALLAGLRLLKVPVNEDFVRVGVAIHDVGKTIHTQELLGPGSHHEPDGEALMLRHGASTEVARVCRSHAQWTTAAETLEEFLIALSDKLWKGVRIKDLEEQVVARIAALQSKDKWAVFVELDSLFEEVASNADSRLARSAV